MAKMERRSGTSPAFSAGGIAGGGAERAHGEADSIPLGTPLALARRPAPAAGHPRRSSRVVAPASRRSVGMNHSGPALLCHLAAQAFGEIADVKSILRQQPAGEIGTLAALA